MQMYRHVLFATDLSKSCDAVGEKAREIAGFFKAKVTAVHVFTPFESGYGAEVDMVSEIVPDFYPSLEKLAGDALKSQVERLGLSGAKCVVAQGSPKREIVRVAEENTVDLIVIGGHGLHGLEYILGSTADGVLHRSKCDVLTVHMRK
jgi:universal stress protein A